MCNPKPHVPFPTCVPMSPCLTLKVCMSSVPCPLNPMSPCLTLKVCMSSVLCPLDPMSPKPHVPMSNPKGVCMSSVLCPLDPMSPKPHVPMSNPKGVYRWVSKNLLCVQMGQICVRRWGTWPVCTDESNLCAQMSPLPHLVLNAWDRTYMRYIATIQLLTSTALNNSYVSSGWATPHHFGDQKLWW